MQQNFLKAGIGPRMRVLMCSSGTEELVGVSGTCVYELRTVTLSDMLLGISSIFARAFGPIGE